MCAAPRKNQFWKFRKSHGRKLIFETPDDLWNEACKYFQWVNNNPLQGAELVKYRGKSNMTKLPRMRAMTIKGLCVFLGITDDTWEDYCKREDFIGVTGMIKNVIFTQKFEGAAAGLLEANLIARELGLMETVRKEVSGPGGGPIPHKIVDMPPDFSSIDEWVAWHEKMKSQVVSVSEKEPGEGE